MKPKSIEAGSIDQLSDADAAAAISGLHRVFVTPESIAGATARLDRAQSKHLLRVLRMDTGDLIGVLDGKGRGWIGRISSRGAEADAELLREAPCLSNPRRTVALALPALKGDRMTFALQKCTEIGVSSFHIVPSERGAVRLDSDRPKRERYLAVMQSAAEQCGAFMLPELCIWDSLEPFFSQLSAPRRYIAWEQEKVRGCRALVEGKDELCIASGPEGGFGAEEIRLYEQNGFEPISLGPRILRAETAAVVVAGLALLVENQ